MKKVTGAGAAAVAPEACGIVAGAGCVAIYAALERAMRRAVRLLKGRHDFSALSANPMREIETPVRTVSRLMITRKGNVLTIAVRANGFLYKMVRSIVGALVKVGEGRLTVEQLRAAIASKKRTALIETAPAKGLFLWKAYY